MSVTLLQNSFLCGFLLLPLNTVREKLQKFHFKILTTNETTWDLHNTIQRYKFMTLKIFLSGHFFFNPFPKKGDR